MRERTPAVYILADQKRGTLYTGVTADPAGRFYHRRSEVVPGFTNRFSVKHLVHIEFFGDVEHAIRREKQLKNWTRQWKIELIEVHNPTWRDPAPDYEIEPSSLPKAARMDPGSSPG